MLLLVFVPTFTSLFAVLTAITSAKAVSVLFISDLGWPFKEPAGSFTKLECTWNVSQVVLHMLRTTVSTDSSMSLCSVELHGVPVRVDTLILMPIEYYTKELADYKEGGMNSGGRMCLKKGGVSVPPGGEAAQQAVVAQWDKLSEDCKFKSQHCHS